MASVVHKDVNAAELLLCRPQRHAYNLLPRQIPPAYPALPSGFGDFAAVAAEFLFRARRQNTRRAFPGEKLSDGPANSAAEAGNQWT